MKNLIGLLLVSGFLVACNSGSNPAPKQEAGGISGGGGGTLPAKPIDTFEVFQVMEEAKKLLRLYYNYERWRNSHDETSSRKFFFGKENLATQLEKVDVEILETKPCKDLGGNDVDASVVATRPNTICLSAFRIAPKLIKETATKEILALLTHEISHFLGANENEAVALQQWVALRIEKLTPEIVSLNWNKTYGTAMEFEGLVALKGAFVKAVKNQDMTGVKKISDEVFDYLHRYSDAWKDLPLAFADYQILQYQDVVEAKVRFLGLYVDSLGNDPHSQWARDTLEKCFAGKSKVTVVELSKNCLFGVDKENIYGDVVIERIAKVEDILKTGNEIYLFLRDMGAHVRAIASNYPIAYFHLPTNPVEKNEFEKFIGSYDAKKINCESTRSDNFNSFKDIVSIDLSPGVVNYPVEDLKVVYFKELRPSGSSSRPIYTGSGMSSQKVSGNENLAVYTEERGTRWYDRQMHGWDLTTRKIQREKNGDLILEMKSESFQYDYRGIREDSYSCKFQLLKK